MEAFLRLTNLSFIRQVKRHRSSTCNAIKSDARFELSIRFQSRNDY